MSYLEKVLTLQNICGAAAAFEGQANLSKLIFTASHNLLLCIVDRKLHLRFFAKWANSSKEFCQGTALFSVLCTTLALPGDSRSVRISEVHHQFCDFCLSDFRPWKKIILSSRPVHKSKKKTPLTFTFDLKSKENLIWIHFHISILYILKNLILFSRAAYKSNKTKPYTFTFHFRTSAKISQGRVQEQEDKTLHFHFPLSLFIFVHLQKLSRAAYKSKKTSDLRIHTKGNL